MTPATGAGKGSPASAPAFELPWPSPDQALSVFPPAALPGQLPGDPVEAAWMVLDHVLDPEVPALSVRDLGLVREIRRAGNGAHGPGLEVVLTPTYSGCPATEAIRLGVQAALEAAGLGPVAVSLRRSPAWTSDWISDEGRRKLAASGIAPPARCAALSHGADAGGSEAGTGGGAGCGAVAQATLGGARPVQWVSRSVPCPRCGSDRTERLSAFGSTACKALYRCTACLEPFEHFKPI